MREKYNYHIICKGVSEQINRLNPSVCSFANPVQTGDDVYWDDIGSSFGGKVLKVEHHPTVSVLIVDKHTN